MNENGRPYHPQSWKRLASARMWLGAAQSSDRATGPSSASSGAKLPPRGAAECLRVDAHTAPALPMDVQPRRNSARPVATIAVAIGAYVLFVPPNSFLVVADDDSSGGGEQAELTAGIVPSWTPRSTRKRSASRDPVCPGGA